MQMNFLLPSRTTPSGTPIKRASTSHLPDVTNVTNTWLPSCQSHILHQIIPRPRTDLQAHGSLIMVMHDFERAPVMNHGTFNLMTPADTHFTSTCRNHFIPFMSTILPTECDHMSTVTIALFYHVFICCAHDPDEHHEIHFRPCAPSLPSTCHCHIYHTCMTLLSTVVFSI